MNKFNLILSMIIFGTIGIFVKYIPISSSTIALLRASIGFIFLLLVILCKKSKISFKSINKNLKFLIPSGMFLGVNWILLFESYRYTTVATATLCYYLAPTFIIIASPFVLKEKLGVKKIICAAVSLVGMVFVSGVLNTGFSFKELAGVLFGIGAALLYASIVLLNKKTRDISSYDLTAFQLFISSLVLLPYVLLTQGFSGVKLDAKLVVLVIFIGIVHTGIAYMLYFGSVQKVKAQTAALFSYIDPVLAVILSAVLLKESINTLTIIGAVLILGASAIGELEKQ
ncbi:MAG: EamA family transporter [Clostridia bacterium]|nr:EamA family transporter [Clostridia bacterium]